MYVAKRREGELEQLIGMGVICCDDIWQKLESSNKREFSPIKQSCHRWNLACVAHQTAGSPSYIHTQTWPFPYIEGR